MENDQERLPAMVACVYEAALDPDLWDQAMERARVFLQDVQRQHPGCSAIARDADFQDWWRVFAANPPDELSRQLLPYLERANRLRQETLRWRAACETGLSALEMLPLGVALLASDGAAIFCNRVTRRIVQQANGLGMDGSGRFFAQAPRENKQLQNHIASAIESVNSTRRHAGVAKISRRNASLPLWILIVAPESSWPGGCRPSAILFISDPDSPGGAVEDLLAAMHGLTRAEARMAAALMTGQTLTEYAASRGITRNTARTQLRHVLAKTGAQRQADLMRIILTGPAIIGLGAALSS